MLYPRSTEYIVISDGSRKELHYEVGRADMGLRLLGNQINYPKTVKQHAERHDTPSEDRKARHYHDILEKPWKPRDPCKAIYTVLDIIRCN